MRSRLLFALVLVSCTRSPEPEVARAATKPLPSTTVSGDRWRCATHADCRMSCAYGAVARAWAEEHIKQECSSGCAAPGITARCDDETCTAHRDGAPYPGCSQHAPDAPRKGS